MAPRPLVLPDTYNGGNSWSEWKAHFENIPAVNEWDQMKQLQRLRIRLTGRAQKALQRVTAESFVDVIKASDERFEPKSRRTRYHADFHARRKKRSEGWA